MPQFSEDRGSILFDPITRSTLQRPSAFIKRDSCDRAVYITVGGAISVNQLVNCTPVLGGTFSYSFLLPLIDVAGNNVDSVALMTDIEQLFESQRAFVQNALIDAISRGPSPLPAAGNGTGPGVSRSSGSVVEPSGDTVV
jgi:hypothetical protein